MQHRHNAGTYGSQPRDPFPTEAIRSVNREPCTHDVDSDPLGYYDVAGKDASRMTVAYVDCRGGPQSNATY